MFLKPDRVFLAFPRERHELREDLESDEEQKYLDQSNNFYQSQTLTHTADPPGSWNQKK